MTESDLSNNLVVNVYTLTTGNDFIFFILSFLFQPRIYTLILFSQVFQCRKVFFFKPHSNLIVTVNFNNLDHPAVTLFQPPDIIFHRILENTYILATH